MVNIICAVLLGPAWGVGAAFVASLIRNLLWPGQSHGLLRSMFGALLCGLVYEKTGNIAATLVGEVFGTAILGGLCALPRGDILYGAVGRGHRVYAYIRPVFRINGRRRGGYPQF